MKVERTWPPTSAITCGHNRPSGDVCPYRRFRLAKKGRVLRLECNLQINRARDRWCSRWMQQQLRETVRVGKTRLFLIAGRVLMPSNWRNHGKSRTSGTSVQRWKQKERALRCRLVPHSWQWRQKQVDCGASIIFSRPYDNEQLL